MLPKCRGSDRGSRGGSSQTRTSGIMWIKALFAFPSPQKPVRPLQARGLLSNWKGMLQKKSMVPATRRRPQG